MKRDLYGELGVDRTVDAAGIKRAYRKRAAKVHPDVAPGDARASAEFRALVLARDVLTDADMRRHYDQTGEIPRNGSHVASPAIVLIRTIAVQRSVKDPDGNVLLAVRDELRARLGSANKAKRVLESSRAKILERWTDDAMREEVVSQLDAELVGQGQEVSRVTEALRLLADSKFTMPPLADIWSYGKVDKFQWR